MMSPPPYSEGSYYTPKKGRSSLTPSMSVSQGGLPDDMSEISFSGSERSFDHRAQFNSQAPTMPVSQDGLAKNVSQMSLGSRRHFDGSTRQSTKSGPSKTANTYKSQDMKSYQNSETFFDAPPKHPTYQPPSKPSNQGLPQNTGTASYPRSQRSTQAPPKQSNISTMPNSVPQDIKNTKTVSFGNPENPRKAPPSTKNPTTKPDIPNLLRPEKVNDTTKGKDKKEHTDLTFDKVRAATKRLVCEEWKDGKPTSESKKLSLSNSLSKALLGNKHHHPNHKICKCCRCCEIHRSKYNDTFTGILELVQKEVTKHFRSFDAYPNLVGQRQAMILAYLRSLKGMWTVPVAGKPVAVKPWAYEINGCAACMLLRIAADSDCLCYLYVVMLSRTRAHDTRRPLRLIAFVEECMHAYGRDRVNFMKDVTASDAELMKDTRKACEREWLCSKYESARDQNQSNGRTQNKQNKH